MLRDFLAKQADKKIVRAIDPRLEYAAEVLRDRERALEALRREAAAAAATLPPSTAATVAPPSTGDASSSSSRDGSRAAARDRSTPARRDRSPAARSVIVRKKRKRAITEKRRRSREELIRDAESKGAIGFRPSEIPGHVRPTHRAIESDYTGARARAALASWPRRLRGFRRIVREWALGIAVERPDDFSSKRSRRIVAYANTIVLLSNTTDRRGFVRIVEGFSRGALAQLSINDDTAKPCGVSYIFATSHDGDRTGVDDCGPMEALKRSGALLADQPPAEKSRPEFLGVPKPRLVNGVVVLVRNAINVYWIRARYRPPGEQLA